MTEDKARSQKEPPQKVGSSWPYWSAMAAATGIALLVRLPAMDGRPLWNDELWRMSLVLEPGFFHAYFLSPDSYTSITSLTYALFIKFLAAFWISPTVLRLSSFIPGTLCAPLALTVVRKAGGNIALALVAALIFALNPSFISYSNEMKPYMFEVCIHLACLYGWLTILMVPQPRPGQWGVCFFLLTLAVFSAPNIVFILPAIGLSFLVHFVIGKDFKNASICMSGFAVLGALSLALYVIAWRFGTSNGMLDYWAGGFEQGGQNFGEFLALKLSEIWRFAFSTIVNMPNLPAWAFGTLITFCVLGAVTGAIKQRRTRAILAFYAVSLGTLCLLNWIRLWPLGAVRANLFLFAQFILFPFIILTQIAGSRIFGRLLLTLAALSTLWPLHSAAGRARYRAQEDALRHVGASVERSDLVVDAFSAQAPIGKAIQEECARHKTLIVNTGDVMREINYITKFDSERRGSGNLLGSPCVRFVQSHDGFWETADAKKALGQALANVPHAWFIYSYLDNRDVAALRQTAMGFGRIAQTHTFDGAGYFEFIPYSRQSNPNTPQIPR